MAHGHNIDLNIVIAALTEMGIQPSMPLQNGICVRFFTECAGSVSCLVEFLLYFVWLAIPSFGCYDI